MIHTRGAAGAVAIFMGCAILFLAAWHLAGIDGVAIFAGGIACGIGLCALASGPV